MNVGDRVAHVNLLGTIVGVSAKGLPVIEWNDSEFTEEDPDTLLVVELPEELNPENEVAEPTENNNGTTEQTTETTNS
jgi:hypothetical protein